MVASTRRRRFSVGAAPSGRQPDHYEGLNTESEIEEDDVESEVPASSMPAPSAQIADLFRRAALEREEKQRQKESSLDEEMSPAERLIAVEKSDPAYVKEYRLRLIHRLLMRSIPLDQIAGQLGISVKTVQRDRAEIQRRLKKEAAKIDINNLLGDTMAFYKEHSAMALRIATSAKTPLGSRLAALRTSMQSRKEMGQWLSVAGVFEVLKFRAAEGVSNADIGRLVRIAETLLGDDTDLGDLNTTDDDLDESIELFL